MNWALQDMTGGIMDTFVFKDNHHLLKQIIDVCMARNSLISTSIQVNTSFTVESRKFEGVLFQIISCSNDKEI